MVFMALPRTSWGPPRDLPGTSQGPPRDLPEPQSPCTFLVRSQVQNREVLVTTQYFRAIPGIEERLSLEILEPNAQLEPTRYLLGAY